MYHKIHKGQGVVWIILIIAIIALIALWISKNPSVQTTTTAPTSTEINEENINVDSVQPTISQTMSDLEIEQELKNLNNSALDIDSGINDTQLDINAK